MTLTIADSPSAEQEFRQAILELRLISHAPARSYEGRSSRSSEEPGGRRPSGGDFDKPHHPGPDASAKDIAEYREDYAAWWTSYQRKTPDHFLIAYARTYTDEGLQRLTAEIRTVIDAWKRTPAPAPGIELEKGSFYWKCEIADSTETLERIRSLYRVSTATVYRYRLKYRGLRKGPSGNAV